MIQIKNPVLRKIWEERSQKEGETLTENLQRVAHYVATNESEENSFFNLMNDGLFFPAGRTMSNSGIGETLTLNNCFLNPVVPDDMQGIFQSVTYGAMTHKAGGGIGYDFSLLRPQGCKTSNDAIASGVVSFMDVFNAQTETVMQGSRRGANMGVLNIYHPDILSFINAKAADSKKLDHFNMSIMVDDSFISAVRADEKVFLHYPVYDKTYHIITDPAQWKVEQEISAKELWDLIMRKAYDNGEPGILFYDNMNRDNNVWYTETITHTNPCGEFVGGTVYGQALPASEYGGACNLGSLFLHNFVKEPFTKDAHIDYSALHHAIPIAVRMLDNIIDINKYPLKHYENYQKNLRTIGLGVTGFADMLAMLGMKYSSKEAMDFASKLMDAITFYAYQASVALAKEKGSFPFLDREKFVQSNFLKKHANNLDWIALIADIRDSGIRNARLISIAPCGTISLTYGNNCSSGIEPIFGLSYDREIRMGGQSEENAQTVKVQDYAYALYHELELSGKKLDVSEDVFVTANDLTVDEHINMLEQIAFHVDMGVSKTINVPTDYSFEDTKNIYMRCWEKGIKGCTIFRPNEIRKGILFSGRASVDTKVQKTEWQRGDIISASDDLISYKRTITSGCGKFYLHSDFDEDTGDQFETFIDIGSGGGCERNLQFISRLISLALRAGVSIKTIIDQAKSIRPCTAYMSRTNAKGDTSKGTSCPSATGFALEDLNAKIIDRFIDESDSQASDLRPDSINAAALSSSALCPECGAMLTFEGGCNVCKGDETHTGCGWSKCG